MGYTVGCGRSLVHRTAALDVKGAGAIRMIWQGFGRWGMQMRGWIRAACLPGVPVLFVAAGCATMGGGLGKDTPPEVMRAAVTERVNARWAALTKGDLDVAYTYLSPASREVVTLATFKAKTRTGSFRDAKIGSVECEAEVCNVKLTLTYDHRVMKGVQTPIAETWVLDRGQVWYVWRQ